MSASSNPQAHKVFGKEADFGRALRVARAIYGISSKELSEKSGKSIGWILKMEREGASSNPSYKSIQAVATAMGTKPGAMLDLAESIEEALRK